MEAYRHKKSEKYFLFVDELHDGKPQFINPEGRPRVLDYSEFFDDPEEGDEVSFMQRGIITEKQLKIYNRIKPFRDADNRLKLALELFSSLPLSKQWEIVNKSKKNRQAEI